MCFKSSSDGHTIGSHPTWSLGIVGDGRGTDFAERSAMILGMNGGALRKRRMWSVYLWKQQHHWSIVLQPASEHFIARVVDDFMHDAEYCCNIEVSSSRFFLVYELLLPSGKTQLSVSVKTDFDTERQCVQSLGEVGPTRFQDVCEAAHAVVDSYRCYSLVGSNCQHFAKDLALKLDTPVPCTPEDEAVAAEALRNAEKVSLVGTAVAVSCVGAIVAPDATLLTATAAAASQAAFGSAVPLVAVALGAGTVGIGAGVVLGSVGAGYGLLHAGLRTREAETQAETQTPRTESATQTPRGDVDSRIPFAEAGPPIPQANPQTPRSEINTLNPQADIDSRISLAEAGTPVPQAEATTTCAEKE